MKFLFFSEIKFNVRNWLFEKYQSLKCRYMNINLIIVLRQLNVYFYQGIHIGLLNIMEIFGHSFKAWSGSRR